jgi:hypothetical protein
MLPDLKFRISAENATATAFQATATQIKAVQAAAANVGTTTGLAAHQMQNLTFQVNDLAQQLATGASPFRAILQQGSQIVQLFGPGMGVRGALKAVGGSIVQFLTNPLTLATIGFAAATQAAFYLFDAVTSGGRSAEDVLKDNKEYVDRIRDSYKDAAAAALDFRDAQQKQADIAQGIGNAAEAQKNLNSELEQLQSLLAVVFDSQFGETNGFGPLQDQMRVFYQQMKDGTFDIEGAHGALLKLAADPAISEGMRETVGEMLSLVDQAYNLQKSLERTNIAIGVLRGSVVKGTSPSLDSNDDSVRRGDNDIRRFLPETKPARRTYGDQQVESIAGVYDALRQQRDALTMTNREQAIANQLAAAHVTATSADGIEIARQTGLLYDQQQAMDALNQAAGFAGNAIYDAFDGLMFQGDKATDVIANMAKALAQAALQATLLGQGPLAGLFGTAPTTSGGVGGIVGSIFSLFTGGHAGGGFIPRGMFGTTNDNELLIAGREGVQVIPPRGSTGASASGSQVVNIVTSISAPNATPEGVSALKAELDRRDKSILSAVERRLGQPRMRLA